MKNREVVVLFDASALSSTLPALVCDELCLEDRNSKKKFTVGIGSNTVVAGVAKMLELYLKKSS